MGGNRQKWMDSMIKQHGSEEAVIEHMKNIARLGGSVKGPKGFASDKVDSDGLSGKERASIAGKIGGTKSRRNKK